VWQERARPGPLAALIAATFDQVAAGLPTPLPALSPG
jgi:hypothetical protein